MAENNRGDVYALVNTLMGELKKELIKKANESNTDELLTAIYDLDGDLAGTVKGKNHNDYLLAITDFINKETETCLEFIENAEDIDWEELKNSLFNLFPFDVKVLNKPIVVDTDSK